MFFRKLQPSNIDPHRFRYTQASLYYGTGENPIVISKRLGHKQVSTAQDIYIRLLKGVDKGVSENLLPYYIVMMLGQFNLNII